MKGTKLSKKNKQTKIFETMVICSLVLIANAFSTMQDINHKLDNKVSYSTETAYFAQKDIGQDITVENKQANMPISIALKNITYKGGIYKLSYYKDSDEDKKDYEVDNNIVFDKKNETKIINVVKNAEPNTKYHIKLKKMNDDKGFLDVNVFNK